MNASDGDAQPMADLAATPRGGGRGPKQARDAAQRDELTAAFALKQEKVPFKWAGKKKEDGLDSAAFAALALGQAGVIDKPDTATAQSLQGQLKVSQEGEPQPGDLLFFDGGNVMFYLGRDNAVGMLPEGAVTKNGVIKGKGIGFKYLGYGSIKYE